MMDCICQPSAATLLGATLLAGLAWAFPGSKMWTTLDLDDEHLDVPSATSRRLSPGIRHLGRPVGQACIINLLVASVYRLSSMTRATSEPTFLSPLSPAHLLSRSRSLHVGS